MHKTNEYDFHLINLIISDEFGVRYSAVYFITNFTDTENVTCKGQDSQLPLATWRLSF